MSAGHVTGAIELGAAHVAARPIGPVSGTTRPVARGADVIVLDTLAREPFPLNRLHEDETETCVTGDLFASCPAQTAAHRAFCLSQAWTRANRRSGNWMKTLEMRLRVRTQPATIGLR